tara:strand:+ start:1007 stop:1165 length:159 start_codon:yes stop_codon:yes gene_type:complete
MEYLIMIYDFLNIPSVEYIITMSLIVITPMYLGHKHGKEYQSYLDKKRGLNN